MKATRDAFGEQLVKSSKDQPRVVALSADLAKATRLSKFQEAYPDRFFECGIAECNMIGIGSGMSEHGYKVFMASFASFLTGKYDVIRVSIGYSNAPVVLVGTHAGLAIGKDGVTQMGLEDVSLMRSMPNMTVLQPASPLEAREMTKYLVETELSSPVYLRLGRQPTPEIFSEDYKFKFGKAMTMKEGTDVSLIASGCILSEVLKASEILESKGLSCKVINMHTIKPIDKEAIIEAARETSFMVTVEDHSIIGGLGSSVAEVLCDSHPAKLIRIGLNDVFPESAPPVDLWEKYGLTASKIADRVLK